MNIYTKNYKTKFPMSFLGEKANRQFQVSEVGQIFGDG